MWYLCFIPLIIPALSSMNWRRIAVMLTLWIFAQAGWLALAFGLEFQGKNDYFLLWLAGTGFFTVNCWCITELLKARKLNNKMSN